MISVETARAMARAAREGTGAGIGIGITGVAGPDPQEDKPVGTMHIALDDGDGGDATSYVFNQGRDAVKRRAVTSALSLIRRSLLARG